MPSNTQDQSVILPRAYVEQLSDRIRTKMAYLKPGVEFEQYRAELRVLNIALMNTPNGVTVVA